MQTKNNEMTLKYCNNAISSDVTIMEECHNSC